MSKLSYDREFLHQTLAKINIFAQFINTEIDSLLNVGEIKSFRKGQNIIIEGEQTRGLYILLQGHLSLYKTNYESKNLHRIGNLDPGTSFGEFSLLDDISRAATITSETPSVAYFLGYDAFIQFLDDGGSLLKAKFYESCARDLAQKFRNQNNQLIELQFLLWNRAFNRSDQSNDDKSQENSSLKGI